MAANLRHSEQKHLFDSRNSHIHISTFCNAKMKNITTRFIGSKILLVRFESECGGSSPTTRTTTTLTTTRSTAQWSRIDPSCLDQFWHPAIGKLCGWHIHPLQIDLNGCSSSLASSEEQPRYANHPSVILPRDLALAPDTLSCGIRLPSISLICSTSSGSSTRLRPEAAFRAMVRDSRAPKRTTRALCKRGRSLKRTAFFPRWLGFEGEPILIVKVRVSGLNHDLRCLRAVQRRDYHWVGI